MKIQTHGERSARTVTSYSILVTIAKMVEQEPTIKIAFIGTSCVGKTTLLEEVSRRLSGNSKIAKVPEAARAYFTANPTITE